MNEKDYENMVKVEREKEKRTVCAVAVATSILLLCVCHLLSCTNSYMVKQMKMRSILGRERLATCKLVCMRTRIRENACERIVHFYFVYFVFMYNQYKFELIQIVKYTITTTMFWFITVAITSCFSTKKK